jgi:hypothetical protein
LDAVAPVGRSNAMCGARVVSNRLTSSSAVAIGTSNASMSRRPSGESTATIGRRLASSTRIDAMLSSAAIRARAVRSIAATLPDMTPYWLPSDRAAARSRPRSRMSVLTSSRALTYRDTFTTISISSVGTSAIVMRRAAKPQLCGRSSLMPGALPVL